MKRVLFVILIGCVSVLFAQESPYKFRIFSPQLVPVNKSFDVSVIGKIDASVNSIKIEFRSNNKFRIKKASVNNKNTGSQKISFKKTENAFSNFSYAANIPVKRDSSAEFMTYQISATFKGIRKNINLLPLLTVKDTSGNVYYFSPDEDENSGFYISPISIKSYVVQNQAGKALLLKNNSEFSLPVKSVNDINKLLIEFWAKFDGPVKNFFEIVNGENGDSILGFTNNSLQLLSPSFKSENELFNDCSLIKKTWHHFSILMNKEDSKINIYVDDEKSCSFNDDIFSDMKDIYLKFINRNSGNNFEVDLLKIWNINDDIEQTFANKHFVHANLDGSDLIGIFNFDENNLISKSNSVLISNSELIKSDAPIFSPTPILNISVSSNIISLEWKGDEYSSAKQYILQKAIKNGNFQDIYETDVSEDKDKTYYFSDVNNEENVIYYRLKQTNSDGTTSYSQILKLGKANQEEFVLEQNYPNPFNPTTSINFEVLQPGDYEVIVYDLVGNSVATLFKGNLSEGKHSFRFDGSNLPSGIYFYEVKSPHTNLVHKMILAK